MSTYTAGRPHQDMATARRQILHVLNDILAHMLDLGLHARRLRRQMTSPTWPTLREMLGHFVNDLERYSDLVAERALRLSGSADGHTKSRQQQDVRNGHTVPEHRPFNAAALAPLTMAVASAAARTRQQVDSVTTLGDPLSAHVLREVTWGLDTWAWCLDIHLEGAAGAPFASGAGLRLHDAAAQEQPC